MPASLNDYDKNDDDSGGLSEGFTPAQSSAVGSATGGPQQAKPQKQQDDSYVPWSSFVSANQDVSQREAGKLTGEVQGDVSKAQSDLSGAQSTFNQGIDSNYNRPAQKTSATPQTAPAKQQEPSSEQNQPQGGGISGSWDAFSTPSASAASASTRAPRAQAAQQATPAAPPPSPGPAPNPVPLSPPEMRQPAQSQVTSANPTNAIIPTQQLTKPAPAQNAGTGLTFRSAQQMPTGAPSQQRQSISGYGYQGLKGNTPNGPHDLEQAAGPQGWNQLLADTLKAQQESQALGSETGVQGLLQQQQYSPQQNTAFDATLINGQGAPQFEKLAHEYGGNQLGQGVINAEQSSQDAWKQLAGDEAAKQKFDAAGTTSTAPTPTAQINPVTSLGAPTSIGSPDGWNSDYENAWNEAQSDGQQAANANGGHVVTVEKDDPNATMGWDRGAFGSQSPSINVYQGKGWSREQAAQNWWGGAGGPYPGDSSISAADWYALAEMPPEARAAWWKHNHAGG